MKYKILFVGRSGLKSWSCIPNAKLFIIIWHGCDLVWPMPPCVTKLPKECQHFWFRVGFGSVLSQFWIHFGSILGPFWVRFGSVLGPFWVRFGWILVKILNRADLAWIPLFHLDRWYHAGVSRAWEKIRSKIYYSNLRRSFWNILRRRRNSPKPTIVIRATTPPQTPGKTGP